MFWGRATVVKSSPSVSVSCPSLVLLVCFFFWGGGGGHDGWVDGCCT